MRLIECDRCKAKIDGALHLGVLSWWVEAGKGESSARQVQTEFCPACVERALEKPQVVTVQNDSDVKPRV